jgi:cytochrome P450
MATAAALPPGPPFRVLQAIRYVQNPYSMLREFAQRYGDVFTIRTARLCVMTGRPELIRQIIGAPADQYGVNHEKGPSRVLGMNGMAQLAGHELRRDRRLVVPHFQGDILNGLAPMMRAATLDAFTKLVPGQAFTMRGLSLDIALDVILRTCFGADTEERRKEFRAATRAFSEGFGAKSFLMLCALGADGEFWPPFRRFAAARAWLERLLQEAIDRARTEGPARGDILGRIVAARYDKASAGRADGGMADKAIIDNMITTLIAGHETTVVSLSWAFYWLYSHPRHLERLLAELAPLGPEAEPSAYTKLPFLDAVTKETLRLYPVVTDINRVLAKPMQLGRYELPAGTTVAGATAILHYDPELYPDPDAFRPERFLERRFAPYEYTPFGGGERMCPGSQFSPYELKVLLGTLLTHGRFRLLDQGPMAVKRSGAMMGPATGVRLVYEGPAGG